MNRFIAAWKGRSNRREFWLFYAILIVGYIAASALLGPLVASIVVPLGWVFIATRRLHDFGASGWIATIPFGLGFIGGFARSVGVPMPDQGVWIMILGGISLGFALVIGAWPGSRKPEAPVE